MSQRTRFSALLTDLYELTMAAAYFENKMDAVATFELFVRDLPPGRGYLLAAGLEQALDYLENVRFTPAEVDFLRQHEVFAHVGAGFFDYLQRFRFAGEVWAVPEGTPIFGDEPLLQVTASIIEAQIVETYLLSAITFQTLIATKAARVVEAAQGRGVVEFGTRRAHGPEAGVLAARAAFIGGAIGTSNVEAGLRYGVPTYGTVAHSFVMAHKQEEESFRRFAQVFPDHVVLLVDTYDTLAAIDKIIQLGLRPKGVRLDSGNTLELSREVRRRLDRAGLEETQIFASGDLNEYVIAKLLAEGAPIDFFGVGTELATSRDAPALGGVYKLVELLEDFRPHYRAKFSEDKATFPGRKQVFRFRDSAGLYDHDVLARAEENYPEGEALLIPVLRNGKRTAAPRTLVDIQAQARKRLRELPEKFRQLRDAPPYRVDPSQELQKLLREVRQKMLEENSAVPKNADSR